MRILDGQAALVTGAGRGIGRAICLAFAREGARIAAAARSLDEVEEVTRQIRDAGGSAFALQMDVRSEDSIKAGVAAAVAALGPLDMLVNNAAIIALRPITETSADTWDDVMSTNARGVFLLCREVLPVMVERGSGRIINIGSMAGRRGYEEQGAYCASKHALVGLCKVLALENRDTGVRVHLLSPGGVLTGLSTELRASRGEAEDSPEWMTDEEVARAAVYLCSQTGAAFTDELVLRRFASEPWR